jgi:uncharacterized membrane protein YedE/YeeE
LRAFRGFRWVATLAPRIRVAFGARTTGNGAISSTVSSLTRSLDAFAVSLRGGGSHLFKRTMPAWQGGIIFGILNVSMYAFFNMPIGVFPGITLWGTSIYNLLGVKVASTFGNSAPLPLNVPLILDVGLALGVLFSVLLSREFKIRRDSWRGYGQGFLGGALMGLGAVIAASCNVGGFYSALSALSLSGFGMMIGLIPGAFIGGTILMWQSRRKMLSLINAVSAPPSSAAMAQEREGDVSRRSRASWLVLALAISLTVVYASMGLTQLAGVLGFGVLFGIVIQRSRFCFAAAFRDVFTARNTRLMKGIVYSLTVGVLGIGLMKYVGWKPVDSVVLPFGICNVVGGLIFGLGMVLAGGCGIGMIWRSAEGSIRMWFAFYDEMLVSAAWPIIYWAQVGSGWLYGAPVFIPDLFGWAGGFAFTLGLIWLWYLVLRVVERRR